MPRIVFIESNGFEHAVQADVGLSLMKAAIENGVPGIEAVCGGVCACATCHCYVASEWFDRLPAIEEIEDELLEDANAERRPTSRLSCQVQLTDALEGLVVELPIEQ